jgi:hypothetical protein
MASAIRALRTAISRRRGRPTTARPRSPDPASTAPAHRAPGPGVIALSPLNTPAARALSRPGPVRPLMWNHGGASDEVAGRCVVSTLSPASDYFRRLPAWAAQNTSGLSTIAIMRSALRASRCLRLDGGGVGCRAFHGSAAARQPAVADHRRSRAGRELRGGDTYAPLAPARRSTTSSARRRKMSSAPASGSPVPDRKASERVLRAVRPCARVRRSRRVCDWSDCGGMPAAGRFGRRPPHERSSRERLYVALAINQ